MTQPFVLPFEDSLAHPRRNGNCRFHHSLVEGLAESLANLAAYHTLTISQVQDIPG